jgi:hypothetical protein
MQVRLTPSLFIVKNKAKGKHNCCECNRFPKKMTIPAGSLPEQMAKKPFLELATPAE